VAKSLALLLLLAAALASSAYQTSADNQAGLVVAFDDGRVESYCIEFSEPEISGLELLQRSGLALAVSDAGMGAALCQVEETGCPASNCFCECRGGDCYYWSYWSLSSDENQTGWQYAVAGSSLRRLGHGDVDGWTWGPGSLTNAVEPPRLSFEEICNAPFTATPEAVAMADDLNNNASSAEEGSAETAEASPVDSWLDSLRPVILWILLLAFLVGLAGLLFLFRGTGAQK